MDWSRVDVAIFLGLFAVIELEYKIIKLKDRIEKLEEKLGYKFDEGQDSYDEEVRK